MSAVRACSAALVAALVLLPVLPAAAASGITSPGAGEVVTAHAVVPLRAVVEGPDAEPSELSLRAPGASTADVVAVSTSPDGGELAHDLDTACAAAACVGSAPAANGTWTLTLSGAAEDARTFVLRIPPAAPVEVRADRSERGVTVRWQQGDEPDLRGFRVEDASGRLVRDRVALDACDAERFCSAEVPETSGPWAVRALRATCPDCRDLLVSPPSDLVQAEGVGPVEAAAVPPAPAGGQPAQPQRPGQADAFRSAFGSGRPVVQPPAPPPGRAVLPALPQDLGEYGSELGYQERELVVAEPRAPLSRAQEAVTSALLTGERVRLLVLSALMVGGSLWLRRWARRVIAD